MQSHMHAERTPAVQLSQGAAQVIAHVDALACQMVLLACALHHAPICARFLLMHFTWILTVI